MIGRSSDLLSYSVGKPGLPAYKRVFNFKNQRVVVALEEVVQTAAAAAAAELVVGHMTVA